jgi:transcriptional regulator with XRE-family HTH domain
MKAVVWIDRVKAAQGWESDYRIAKELGITRGALSQIRTGDSATIGEETSIKVAKALGIDPAGIIIDQLAERSKNTAVRATLSRVAASLCILCKVAIRPIFPPIRRLS